MGAKSANKKVSLPLAIIGVIGELMICVGVVLGLFVVWQVWWTNLEVGGKQDEIVAATRAGFGAVDTNKTGQPQAGDPPVMDANIAHNATIGLMHIPRLGGTQTTAIREGESLDVLNEGAFGHYKNTAMPGAKGNFASAIHRDSYGSRVLHIDDLRVGDPIVVETEDTWYVYKFTDYEIVDPTDVYVVSPDPYAARKSADPNGAAVEPTERYLTITTCHPPLVSNKRWIVHAKFDHWVKRSDGMPAELINPNSVKEIQTTGTTIRDAVNDGFHEVQKSLAGTAAKEK
ncbi:MAG: class E sortase [Actinomycetaceae bacterium]|nr:class E sortase [Arcanobacterium sp.]MDD7687247.1 class E sortase [Actinomycetaceae bacterium]MDY5273455.1 class E sortase [Arcanobacterium sp.]